MSLEAARTRQPGALVEGRTALERSAFELSVLANGGTLTKEQEALARKKGGVWKLLEEVYPDYRHRMEFQNFVFEGGGIPFRIPIPDIRTFRRLDNKIGSYAHLQLDPSESDEAGEKFIGGVAVLDEVEALVRPLLESQRGGTTTRFNATGG